MELGLYTFAALPPEAGVDGERHGQRLRELLEEADLAEQVGLDVFGVGEHHRPDFAVSAPAVVLAAIAERTSRIRLTSAVSVISTDDPVRVFEEFATLDALSGGRAEIMAGRGSFTESFPLFGYDLDDYDGLFAEKLDLLLRLREGVRVSWKGRHRAPIEDMGVYPRPVQDPLPVWVGTGGNPESAIRAGALGLPLALAIIGGEPERFAPIAKLFRQAAARSGHAAAPAFSINSHGHIAPTSQQALDESFPPVSASMNRIGRERNWAPMTRPDYERAATLHGANFVGSPPQVIEKILFQHGIFGHDRFLLQFGLGAMPHAQVLRSIELLGTEVAPLVRAELARSDLEPGSVGR
jgi:probable LLM family oxidoreductase